MKQYRGYYIDNCIFHSTADIDEMIKRNAIRSYRQAVELFTHHPEMEYSIYCSERADFLHDQCGMSWTEIEEIEISVYEAIA